MAPKRKHRGSSPKKSQDEQEANMDTDEFTEHVRSKINKKLERSITRSNRIDDLDLAVKTTRALISSNKEIWQRCVDSGCGPADNKLVFKKVAFTKVKVETTWQRKLNFQAVPEFTRKDFGSPKAFPEQLTNIIAPTLAENGIFTDYDKYFETILLLNDETQLACLCILKKHLEDIQILLGGIDGWLMAGSFCIDFIVDTFKMRKDAMEPPEVAGCNANYCGKDHANVTCINCNYTATSLSYYDDCGAHGQGRYHSYYHPTPVTLKYCSTAGEHNHTFDISQEAQQGKLKTFLDFVS